MQAEPLVLAVPSFAEGRSADTDPPLIRLFLVASPAFAVIGLGVLRSRRAEPLLIPLFEAERREKGSGPTYLARALWRIKPDPRWRAALTDVLSSAEFYIQRMNAAIALRDVHDPGVIRPLIAALDDPEVAGALSRGLHAPHPARRSGRCPEPAGDALSGHGGRPARLADGKRDVLAAIAGRPVAP